MSDTLPHDCEFLIVGAGSAGCVLANRLSADSRTRVVLVEAGPCDQSWLIRTPAAVGALMRHRRFNWNYATTPQKYLGDRSLPMPRGRTLGGTSSINGMVYVRGAAQDFDEWAERCGPQWSFAHVLPYFIRSENNRVHTDRKFHGLDGPLTVDSIRPHNPLVDRFLRAADTLGFERRRDFNEADIEGFGTRQATIRDGRRESSASAFLRPARNRPNLHVLTDCLVHRVVIEGGRARGIELERGGRVHRLSAHREIVLCAGAFASPALLMRSGIGEPANLRALGITPIDRNPEVGRNLTDHVSSAIVMRTKHPESYGLSWTSLPRSFWNVFEYALFKRGPLASNVFEAHGFIRSQPRLPAPDLQIIFMPAYRNPSGFPIPLGHGYGINVALLTPRSRGTVTLESAAPNAAPLIDPNFMSVAEDMKPMIHGLKVARAILDAMPFRECRSWEELPGPQVQDDAGLEAHVRNTSGTVFHPVSTCRMGDDAQSVVDPLLRVRRIEGLRVADASVFPTIVRGNTNAAVIMVAEKAADMMLGKAAPAPIDISVSQ